MSLNNQEIALWLACAHCLKPRRFVGNRHGCLRGHEISWGVIGTIRLGNLPIDSAGIADCEDIRWEIAQDNAAGTHDRVIADAHARADHTRSSEPHVMANGHGFCSLEPVASCACIERMQCGVDVNPRPDLSVVADANGIAVQEDTSVIDENVAADVNVPSVVAAERRLDLG